MEGILVWVEGPLVAIFDHLSYYEPSWISGIIKNDKHGYHASTIQDLQQKHNISQA